MNRKIVFFDVDGTLVDARGKVTESAVEAIRQLRKNGHLAFINSGRTLFDLEGNPEVAKPGFDGYVGGCGTHIRVQGVDLRCAVIPMEYHQILVRSAKENHIRLFLEGADGIYISMDRKEQMGLELLLGRLKDSLIDIPEKKILDPEYVKEGRPAMHIQKFLSWSETKEERDRFAEDLKELLTPIYKEDGCGEFVMNGYDKGEAILFLLEYYGLTREDCYVFGDSENDIAMFECCRHSILMGNGSESLKTQVEYVTDSVEKDGIAKALKHYGLI